MSSEAAAKVRSCFQGRCFAQGGQGRPWSPWGTPAWPPHPLCTLMTFPSLFQPRPHSGYLQQWPPRVPASTRQEPARGRSFLARVPPTAPTC